jgi:hypothetical protein
MNEANVGNFALAIILMLVIFGLIAVIINRCKRWPY